MGNINSFLCIPFFFLRCFLRKVFVFSLLEAFSACRCLCQTHWVSLNCIHHRLQALCHKNQAGEVCQVLQAVPEEVNHSGDVLLFLFLLWRQKYVRIERIRRRRPLLNSGCMSKWQSHVTLTPTSATPLQLWVILHFSSVTVGLEGLCAPSSCFNFSAWRARSLVCPCSVSGSYRQLAHVKFLSVAQYCSDCVLHCHQGKYRDDCYLCPAGRLSS